LTRGKKEKDKEEGTWHASRKKELNRRLTDAKKDKSLKVINTEVAVALIDYVGV
jgi:hypothetical protein